jgi:cytochrome c-type biogenesis protein CcmH/NrfG
MPSTGPKNPDPLTQKITALLAKAEGYIGTQQFDKAIATAESVLELDPGNASAAATIKRAKTKQMELLKSGSTVE